MEAVVHKLRTAGVTVTRDGKGIRIQRTGKILPFDITTAPFPGFPTDRQARMMVLAMLALGTSNISEMFFENRSMHVPELTRMGAEIEVHGRRATARAVKSLSGASVMATDLPASASLVIAGLVASDETEVRRVYHLDRRSDGDGHGEVDTTGAGHRALHAIRCRGVREVHRRAALVGPRLPLLPETRAAAEIGKYLYIVDWGAPDVNPACSTDTGATLPALGPEVSPR